MTQIHFFPDRPNRYSLGAKNEDVKFGTTGSLHRAMQSTARGRDKLADSLPPPLMRQT